MLPEGRTIIPVIFASDATQLTGFSGDKSAWPIYMTLGNFQSSTRQQLSKQSMLLLTLLPMPPPLCARSSLSKQQEYQWQKASVWQSCLSIIFDFLRRPSKKGIVLRCPDGGLRHCHPIVGAWCADHEEKV